MMPICQPANPRLPAAATLVLALALATQTPTASAQGLLNDQPPYPTTLSLDPASPIIDSTSLPVDPAINDMLPGAARVQPPIASALQPKQPPTAIFADVAAPNDAPPSAAPNRWTLSLELPLWFSGLNGTVGTHGLSVPVNASFTDILQDTDSVLGIGGRVEADYGPWILFVDGLYMKLTKDNITVGPATLNFVSTIGLADAGIMYRFWHLSLAPGAGHPTLDVAGGAAARYMHVGLDLSAARGPSLSQNQDWADPLAVGQLTLDLDQHWQLLTRGDIGAGPNTDLTWAAGAYLSYQFAISSNVSGALKLGYQAVSEDYHNGSGRNEFTWDAIMNGPVLVLAITF